MTKSLARTLVARLGFAVVIVSSIAACLALLRADVAPAVTVTICVAASYLTVAILERVFPYRASWLRSHGDLSVDGAWFVTNSALNRLLEPFILGAAVAGAGWLSSRVGGELWPVRAPLLAQLALALVVAELFEYWIHRLMHETDVLWRFHAVHHSAPRLYWLNAVRFHPVDYVLVGIVKLLPLALLGARAEVFALVNVFAAVHGAFQHANVPVRLGALNWIFSMAELHRWHHSRTVAEANHNYGGNLILWDVVFGTRYLPADREPPEDIGLADLPDFPTGYVGQLVSPLRWREISRDRAGARASAPVV